MYTIFPTPSWLKYCTAPIFGVGEMGVLTEPHYFVSKSACQSHSKQISKTIMLEGTGDPKAKPKTFTIKTPF